MILRASLPCLTSRAEAIAAALQHNLAEPDSLIMDFVAAMVLATLLYRLPQERDRRAVLLLIAVMVFGISIWPSVRGPLLAGAAS